MVGTRGVADRESVGGMETLREKLKLKQRRCEVQESKHSGQLKRQGNAGVAGEWEAGECWWGEREES